MKPSQHDFARRVTLCPYIAVHSLQHYANEYANLSVLLLRAIGSDDYTDLFTNLTDEHLKTVLGGYTIRTVEECFANAEKDVLSDIRQNPEKVARLNAIARRLRGEVSLQFFKQCRNEVSRLLYGKRTDLPYPGPDFDPNLLEL